MFLRKVTYADDHPRVGASGGSLPQQLPHSITIWGDGVLPGRGPQADVGYSPHVSAGRYYLLELSHLVLLMDCPVLPPQRARVCRYAPGLDGYCPGGNAAEHPHCGGELCMEFSGGLYLFRAQGCTAAPLPIASTLFVAWGTHGASERLSGCSW